MEKQETELVLQLRRSYDIYKCTIDEMHEMNNNSPKQLITAL
jgi:hypothetical protein